MDLDEGAVLVIQGYGSDLELLRMEEAEAKQCWLQEQEALWASEVKRACGVGGLQEAFKQDSTVIDGSKHGCTVQVECRRWSLECYRPLSASGEGW